MEPMVRHVERPEPWPLCAGVRYPCKQRSEGNGFKSLDELPLLINVLKGEMSLVGPRPPIPAEVKEYEIWQRRRLSMKPGLTCIWQITPHRNEVSFEDWMNMDLKYIDTWSLALDFKIIFSTALVMLTGAGR
jgi:lipopolysaccharide/colanic/teichoic acid biosynthesis glycosyltransferase